jgi:hypothetical protein
MPPRITSFAFWALLPAACSGSSAGGAGDASPSYGYGASDAGGQTTIKVTGAVVGLGGSATNPITPLDGVMVCVVEHSEIPCATTDAAGTFTLAKLAADTDVGVSFTRTGYYGVVLLAHTGDADLHLPTANMSTDAAEAAFFQAAGWTYPSAEQGILHVHVQGAGQTSCDGLGQNTITASTGATPVYEKTCADANTPGGPDPALSATTTSGNADFLVAAGTVDATNPSSTLLCDVAPFPGWGWTATGTSSVRALVVAGHETLVALQCK